MVVEKWQSTASGLTVLWANFESPLLNAYITISTEIFEDSGVPHTLEHLVFLGSNRYPYKGVLDSLANRAFAQGTNAWTANDHTAYTLTTAGAEGFLRMLPIYCDHVFFPTLTDAGFVTEVYHVNPKLEDAGVVYSEMQGRENTSGDLLELKTQRMLYPPQSGYRSETGGLMSALRVLTIDDIRNYHAQYYAPHNAALVLCGPLDREALFDTLEKVDAMFLANGTAYAPPGPPGWKRPFVETRSAIPPVIDGTAIHMDGLDDADPPKDGVFDKLRRRAFVEFPEKDESMGEVQISWVGPPLTNNLALHALDVLGAYLTDSAVSPLQRAFVEIDKPLSTDICVMTTERAGASILSVIFSSVPTAELDTLDAELVAVLRDLVENGVDMQRMHMVLRRERLRLLSQLEMRPADCFSDVLIHEFLYGHSDGSNLPEAMDDMKRFDAMDAFSACDWADLLERYFIHNARLVVVGRPSASMAVALKDETKARVAQREATWSAQEKRALEKALDSARRENDAPIPPRMLQDFAIPDSSTIAWIPVATARVGPSIPGVPARLPNATAEDEAVQAHVDKDAPPPPFFIQFDQVSSQFVLITLVFSTACIPQSLRAYLSFYLSMLFSLPITRLDGSGEKLSYEEVVKRLDEDVLEYDVAIGLGSSFAENVAIEFKVERTQYRDAIAWLRDLLWGSEFSLDRLRIVAAKLQQSLPEQKRDGRAVSWALSRTMLYAAHDSTQLANSVMAQATQVPEIVAQLAAEPQRVVDALETLRGTLFRPGFLRVSVAGDIMALDAPCEPWTASFSRRAWMDVVPKPVALPWARDVMTALGTSPSKKGKVCAMPASESSYAVFTAKGVAEYTDPDYAALVVTITILNAMESFLWRYIRGAGLAYGASIRNDPEARHLHFILYRSPDSVKAFVEGGKVLGALANQEESMQIDATMLESAKSSLHYSVADSEGTVGAAAMESFTDSVIKLVGKGRGHALLHDANQVTLDDVQRMLTRYILPLFDPAT
ncbi:hypothetical protein MVES_002292 [Malassezia vespertilionis]|uniref:Uncharacterized protein n=2 Tax=Malassezia vespertilionis TaxID=2020962 RepID=A0A2N1JBS8_9BASI|nr:hypothetical protein MVES_002292 [Malassezia vespertilionis]